MNQSYKTPSGFVHQITTILPNTHISPETAYVVDDYPYGFRLRCKIRYWLEFKKNKGFRFGSQTTNPKVAGEVWNKPKYSTYSEYAAAMYLNEENHVTWAGLDVYADLKEAIEWTKVFGAGVPVAGLPILKAFLAQRCGYERSKLEGKVVIKTTVLGVAQSEVVQSNYTQEEFQQFYNFVKEFCAIK